MPAPRPDDELLAEAGPHGRGFRRIVFLLVSLVTGPTAVLLAVGILMLVFYRARLDLVLGILVVAVVVCVVTGTALALVYIRREARLSQLQSDFVSKVSHELRTPLTSIRLFAESLQRGSVPEDEMEAMIDSLLQESVRLSDHIERLLDWGRMEAGRRVYRLRPDEPGAVVAAACDAFRSATIGREADVRLAVDEGLPPVLLDGDAMADALFNLLSNALKYATESRPIEVSATADSKWVRLAVSDQGIGIPRAEHHRIFQKFYRVDERLSQAAAGSGLGLAIVQHVAKGHGGRVEVESAPGEGSTFTILVPKLRPAAGVA